MRILLTFALTIASINVFSTEMEQRIYNEIEHLTHSTHQKLDKPNLNYSLYKIFDPKTFFVSNFKIKRVLLGHHHYRLGYNPLIFREDISEDALRGVLAHELSHTEDYVGGSTLGTLLPIGVKVSFKKSRIQYERKTDLKVINKGLAHELIKYKEFQYPLLTMKQVEEKKTTYLSPEEVLYAESLMKDNESYYQDWLNNKIPQSLAQFKVYDWFRKTFSKKTLKRNTLEQNSVYTINFSKSSKSVSLIPVNSKGKIYFNRTKKLDLAKKSSIEFKNLSSRISGFIIFDQDLDLLKFHSII